MVSAHALSRVGRNFTSYLNQTATFLVGGCGSQSCAVVNPWLVTTAGGFGSVKIAEECPVMGYSKKSLYFASVVVSTTTWMKNTTFNSDFYKKETCPR